MKNRIDLRLVLMSLCLILSAILEPMPVRAATQDDIVASVAAGTLWLVSQQNDDGSWGTVDRTAGTCLALTHLQGRAYELGHSSPFDPQYRYSSQVELGWEYVFANASRQIVGPQDHSAGISGGVDDPDADGNGYGIRFQPGYHEVYATGICAMALAASGTPDRVISGGFDYDDDGSADTFLNVAQDAMDWLAFSQVDLGIGEGGWAYRAADNTGSGVTGGANTAYAVLGLQHGEEFGCRIPEWVKTELNAWTGTIQDPVNGDADDGGSWYRPNWPWVSELSTAGLLLGMGFADDPSQATGVQDALAYVERHWLDGNTDPGWGYGRAPADYQAMYLLREGLSLAGADLLDLDDDGDRDDDWLTGAFTRSSGREPVADLVSALIEQQERDGAWPGSCSSGSSVKCTTWSLLTMSLVSKAEAQPEVDQPILWPVEYRWGEPEPGYSVENWPIFEGWINVRIENRGPGDAFNVTATVIRGLANTTVPDGEVFVGDVASGRSAWSKDTFTTLTDMDHKVDPCKGGLVWRIDYDDAAGVHRVREGVPQFPPGECPCEVQARLAEQSASPVPLSP